MTDPVAAIKVLLIYWAVAVIVITMTYKENGNTRKKKQPKIYKERRIVTPPKVGTTAPSAVIVPVFVFVNSSGSGTVRMVLIWSSSYAPYKVVHSAAVVISRVHQSRRCH